MSEFLGLGEELRLAKMSRLSDFANRGFRSDSLGETEDISFDFPIIEELDENELDEDEEDEEEDDEE